MNVKGVDEAGFAKLANQQTSGLVKRKFSDFKLSKQNRSRVCSRSKKVWGGEAQGPMKLRSLSQRSRKLG